MAKIDWSDPEARNAYNREYSKRPEVRERNRLAARARRAKLSPEQRENLRTYYREHSKRPEVRERNRIWHKNKRDSDPTFRKRENRRVLERHHRLYQSSSEYREDFKARSREYLKAHPELRVHYQARRRARERKAESDNIRFSIEGCTCTYCDAPAEHVDHIRPFFYGGSDTVDNKTPSCAHCNKSKSSSLPLAFFWRQP